MTLKIDYEVIAGFWHRGEFLTPAPEGSEKPNTIALTATEARHHVLDGSIALPKRTGSTNVEAE